MLRSHHRVFLPRPQPNHHRHVLRINHITASGQEVGIHRHASSIESKSRGHDPGVRERPHNRAQEPEPRCTVRGATAHIAPSAAAQIPVIISFVTIPDGGAGQQDANPSRQIPCFGRGDLCASLGVELQVLSSSDLHALEAGFHLFFNPTGRYNLVKHDAELSISAEPTRATHLQHGTLQPAALGKKQVIGGDERLGEPGDDSPLEAVYIFADCFSSNSILLAFRRRTIHLQLWGPVTSGLSDFAARVQVVVVPWQSDTWRIA